MQFDYKGLPILDQFAEEGFVDCVFKVLNLTADDEFYHFDMAASFEGQEVGLHAKLKKRIGPGFDSDMNLIHEHVYRQGLTLSSIGLESDCLISALAKLYGMAPVIRTMVPSETYTAIALQQDQTDLASNHVRIKIFGRDDDDAPEDDYYESFFNVDLPSGLVYWNEKDEDYREPLMRALSVA